MVLAHRSVLKMIAWHLVWFVWYSFQLSPLNCQNSVGKPGSAGLDDGSFHLTARFYYYSLSMTASTMSIQQPDNTYRTIPVFGSESDSIETNALGDDQVLFYDYYAPQKIDSNLNKATVIFYHGGGYHSGSANSICSYYHIEEWLQRGFHGLIIGYRRGWWGNGSGNPGGEANISISEGLKFSIAVDMAFQDAQFAWQHYNTNSNGHGRWFSGQTASQVYVNHAKASPFYVVMGNRYEICIKVWHVDFLRYLYILK